MRHWTSLCFGFGFLALAACGDSGDGSLFGDKDAGSGGAATGGNAGTGTGGSATGGAAGSGTGGSATGGAAGAGAGGTGGSTGGAAGASSGGAAGSASGGTGGAGTGGSGTGGAGTGGSGTGGSGTGGSGTGGSGTGGSGTGGAGTGGAGTGGAGTGGSGGSGGGCTVKTWCKDVDADTYGDPTTETQSCTPPDTSGWVDKASKPRACEDCSDTTKSAHPNSNHCDGKGYLVSNGSLAVSFDFNCDGKETECGSSIKAVGDKCVFDPTGPSGGVCKGAGYLPTTRSGPGINPYCGSNKFRVCSLAGGTIGCNTTVVEYNPITCN